MKTFFNLQIIGSGKPWLSYIQNLQNADSKNLGAMPADSYVDQEVVWLRQGADVLKTAMNLVMMASDHIQEYLQYRSFTFASLKSVNYLLAIKLLDWKLKRFTVFEVVETSSKAKNFTVRARNSFESFSNCRLKSLDAEKEVRETAIFESKSKEIAALVCAPYENLEASERRLLWHSFISRSSIEIIENSRFC